MLILREKGENIIMNNLTKARLLRKNYQQWKKESLNSKGFFVVFNGFLEGNILKKISGGALKLYMFLGINSNNLTGESFYTVKQMSEYFETSERTISNWIKELEKNNLIIRIQFKYNGVTHTFLNPYKTKKNRTAASSDNSFDPF